MLAVLAAHFLLACNVTAYRARACAHPHLTPHLQVDGQQWVLPNPGGPPAVIHPALTYAEGLCVDAGKGELRSELTLQQCSPTATKQQLFKWGAAKSRHLIHAASGLCVSGEHSSTKEGGDRLRVLASMSVLHNSLMPSPPALQAGVHRAPTRPSCAHPRAPCLVPLRDTRAGDLRGHGVLWQHPAARARPRGRQSRPPFTLCTTTAGTVLDMFTCEDKPNMEWAVDNSGEIHNAGDTKMCITACTAGPAPPPPSPTPKLPVVLNGSRLAHEYGTPLVAQTQLVLCCLPSHPALGDTAIDIIFIGGRRHTPWRACHAQLGALAVALPKIAHPLACTLYHATRATCAC